MGIDTKYYDDSGDHEIDKLIDLYKFYLELIINSAKFIFTITGAMLSWYLIHKNDTLLKYSLLLPLLLNLGFCIICLLGRKPAKNMAQEVKESYFSKRVRMYPDLKPLIYVINLFIICYSIIAIGLALILIFL